MDMAVDKNANADTLHRIDSASGTVPEFRTLPTVVEDLARKYPNNTWMTLPLDPSLSTGWRNVTYRELSCALNGMLGWMEATLGDSMKLGEVIAYIG